VDALFEKGITALSDYEREGYYREIQSLIADAVPQKLVSEGPYLIVAQPWVKGYVYNVAHHQAVDVYNMQLVGKP
jgi:ABC-type transport system substrate-binding protein